MCVKVCFFREFFIISFFFVVFSVKFSGAAFCFCFPAADGKKIRPVTPDGQRGAPGMRVEDEEEMEGKNEMKCRLRRR